MSNKPQNPPLAFFGAQFGALLVGEDNRFKTFDDLCKFAHNDCGINGVTLPTGMLDIKKMISDQDHREETMAHYESLGTPIRRLENHVTGQLVCIHEAVLPRFIGFSPLDKNATRQVAEERAKQDFMEDITLSNLMGLKHIQTFPGGRSNPCATDPWNAYPDKLREYSLAILAEKWESILSYAGKQDVRIGFEIRHIMEDLFDMETFLLFRDKFLLDENAKSAADVGMDVSHYEIEGDNPYNDIVLCKENNLADMGHAKQGFFDESVVNCNRRPANRPWIERAGKFCTFGTHNPQNSHSWVNLMRQSHMRLEEGTHLVIEGECMFLRNPEQSMKVAAENLRLVLAGKSPVPINEITAEPWDGPAFDKFADSGYTAPEILNFNSTENEAIRQRLEQVGIAV